VARKFSKFGSAQNSVSDCAAVAHRCKTLDEDHRGKTGQSRYNGGEVNQRELRSSHVAVSDARGGREGEFRDVRVKDHGQPVMGRV